MMQKLLSIGATGRRETGSIIKHLQAKTKMFCDTNFLSIKYFRIIIIKIMFAVLLVE